MKTLKMDTIYMEKIKGNKKTTTIRKKTDLEVGDEIKILYVAGTVCCYDERDYIVTRITKTHFKYLTIDDAWSDGFDTVRELVMQLQKYYSDLDYETELYIIEFKEWEI